MNISKISPFGYEAKSKNGNSYKATNATTEYENARLNELNTLNEYEDAFNTYAPKSK